MKSKKHCQQDVLFVLRNKISFESQKLKINKTKLKSKSKYQCDKAA